MNCLLSTAMAFFVLTAVQTYGQTVYSGTVGKAAVEFVIDDCDFYPDSTRRQVEAVYLYIRYNDPIVLNGLYDQKKLTFDENGTGKIVFPDFDQKKDTLNGTWTNLSIKKKSRILLLKKYDFNRYDTTERDWQRELLQRESLNNYFFNIIVNNYNDVTGIRVLEKKTGVLFQKIDRLDCSYLKMRSILVEDANGDGVVDFQIYEGGQRILQDDGQTSVWVDTWLTFLFDPMLSRFVESGIEQK
ncbi:MAG: hypothetical protein JW863_14910 [Chitinispirillaceae bacterium]|nr:hypothetical protein [Chitinispirillaceae bacterium]